MAISYEEWLEANRNNPNVWGHSNLQNTMTIPSNSTHRRTMWGNSLSDQDVNSLIQSNINNRNDLSLSSSEVFDAASPIISETHTKKYNDGNSITTTIKGTYNDAKDKVSETFDTLSEGRQNIEDNLIAGKANINNAIIDGATNTWDYITSGRKNIEDALISGRTNANDAITGYLSDGYDAASDAVAGTFADSRVFGGWFDGENYHGIADAYEHSIDAAKSLGKKGAEVWDEFGPGSGYLSGAYDKLLYGNEIPDNQAGSNESIAAAENKVSEAITLAEEETGLSYEVPSMNDIHPVDAHPAVIAAKQELQNQLLAQKEFKEEDQVNASKVLTSIKSSRPWKNLERIAGELEQKGYKIGDDFTEFAAENPMLTLASMYFGGPAITTVAGTSIRLASYLASKAPWVLNKLKWVASPSGIVITLAGGEQYLNNKEEVDAWIAENVPQSVHSPLETLADALTSDKPDSALQEDIETFLTSSESGEQVSVDGGSSNNSSVLDGETSTSETSTAETSTAETSTAETSTAETSTAETPSIFEVASDLGTIDVSEAEAQVAEDLTITTGVENLSPTTDEAAKVLAKTPELIERMNSLADYMDSTTDEEALAAARQAAIDIENDPSHSDLTSAAAMTFIASMLFGGNLTDSFNAAFTPVGNYYTRKRETAAKIAEEKRLEEAVIRKEERAAKRAAEVYEKERADELEDQEKADNLAIKLYNAEQLAINTRFNIEQSNKRIIAEAKAKGQTIEAVIKARKAETARLVSGREKYISDKINGTSDDFAEKLLMAGKKTVGEQLVTALADIQDVVGRAKDIYGEPVQFDLTMTNPRNREAIDGALNDYRNDVMAGIDGGRTLTTYVTDRIIKRELAGFEQVIKPEWFQVPVKDHVSTYIPSKEQMEAWGRKDSDYNYGKLKSRGKHGNTEKAFAESTKKSYDKISNYAYSTDTASGNAMGMDNATRFFVKDFQDMRSNKPQEFDRMVRMAVKEGLHPFTYFVISYPSKAKFGKRFESKEQ